jgi:hypothetical protein
VHNLKGEEVSVDINLPDGVTIAGTVIKGSGDVKLNGRVVSVKLKPNTFVIVK